MMPMFDSLFTYVELDEADLNCVQFGGVTFIKDFGPWSKGDNVPILAFDLVEGSVSSYDTNGTLIVKRDITLAVT